MIKKIFTSLLILFFIAALCTYFFGSKILSKSIKTGVETFGPKVTQTPVKLDEVKLSILSGNGQLSGLYVGNPEGFSSENIFSLGQIEIDIESGSLLSDQVVINKIYIKEPHIRYEKSLKSSNLKELLKNIEESTGSGATAETEGAPSEDVATDESAPGKDVFIKEFVIENPNVFLGVIGLGTTVPLPSIELTNISSSEEEIAATILKQVIAKLFENIKSASTNTAGSLSSATEEILDSVKNQSKEPLKQVNEGIKNLFGK
ncbi:MAG: hypothetical protein ACJAT5_000347 [Lentimonas sp.]|jgi:hypothetical protein